MANAFVKINKRCSKLGVEKKARILAIVYKKNTIAKSPKRMIENMASRLNIKVSPRFFLELHFIIISYF